VSAGRTTPIWLAHHWPDQYDRCVVVGRRHVCRRCLFMYPVAFVVAAVAVAGWALPSPWSQIALVVLPLPALAEFVGEHRRLWAYAPVRHTVLSVLQGLGMGVGFGRYLETPTDPWFWGVGILYSLVALAAALTAPKDVDEVPVAD
jgi:hypothetical protein